MVFVSCEDYKTAYFSCSVTPGVQTDLWNVEKQSIPCDDGDSAVSCMVRMHRTLRRRTNETEISACRPMGPRGSGRTLSPTHSSLLLASEYELVEKNDCTFTYLLTYKAAAMALHRIMQR